MSAQTWAVCCSWKDLRREMVAQGTLVLVLEAPDPNAAQDAAYALRPDLWERTPGVLRQHAIYPAEIAPVPVVQEGGEGA